MRKLLLLLLLAVLSTYVVSSACVILAHVLPTPASMVLTPAIGHRFNGSGSSVVCQIMVDRLRLPGVEQVTLTSSSTFTFSSTRSSRSDVLSVTDGYAASDLATGILDGKIDQAVAAQQLIWTRSGWPWLALESRAQCDATRTDRYGSVTWGIPIPMKPGTAGIPVLPLRPVWPGFALSVGLWMCVWAVPIVFVQSLRVYLRYAGARCWQCGYDLRDSNRDVCPECGTNKRHSPGPALALVAARCGLLWRPPVRFVLCILLGLGCTVLVSAIAARRLASFWPPWPSGYVGIHPKATVFDPIFADNPVTIYGCECRVWGARRVRLAINYTAAKPDSAAPLIVTGDPNASLESVARGRDFAALIHVIEHGDVSLTSVKTGIDWVHAGWPFLSFGYSTRPSNTPLALIGGGAVVDLPYIFSAAFVMPLTPLWPGLIGNVLVWSSVPLVLFFAVPRLVRKRAGLFIHRADATIDRRPLPHPGQKE